MKLQPDMQIFELSIHQYPFGGRAQAGPAGEHTSPQTP